MGTLQSAKGQNKDSQEGVNGDLITSPFPILKPQNPWIDEFYVVAERRATDFKAPKL